MVRTLSRSITLSLAFAAGLLLTAGCGDVVITGVSPATMSLFGHDPVEIHGENFDLLAVDRLEILFGENRAVNIHIESPTRITCLPQGNPLPGPVGVYIANNNTHKVMAFKEDVLTYLPTPYPELSLMLNFGPSLSAGVSDMGYSPQGQIFSVPGFIASQLEIYFPQRIMMEEGVPRINAPHQTELVFVGDGVRECWIPAIDSRYVPAPGEVCDPVFVNLESLDIIPLVLDLLPDLLTGIIRGEGLMAGVMQDPFIENRNYGIPGAQMIDYVFGTRIGFNLLQQMIFWPEEPLYNPFCLGEPVVKMICESDPPADLVVGFDWFFDSVLFGHPPHHDLYHQMFYAMICLATGEYYDMDPCYPGSRYGGWGVPLVKDDGTLERTFQPYEGFEDVPESGICSWTMNCRRAEPSDIDAALVGIESRGFSEPKENYVVDYFLEGHPLREVIGVEADLNGDGVLDMDFVEPGDVELTAEIIASILLADPDFTDNPKAVVLSTMPWPAMSPSGQGGDPGGGDDQFAEVCNVGVNALVDLFNEAFDLAGLPNNIIMLDTFALTKDVIQGNRPDLTHQLDGDPETLDIFYEYELDLQGNPIKRNLTKYGGGFSLDHLHMSHTLNAAMAYEVVDKMNQRLGLSIPLPDLPAIWEADLYNPRKFDPSIQCEFQGICP